VSGSWSILICALCAVLTAYGFQRDVSEERAHRTPGGEAPFDPTIEQNAARMIQEGRSTFRHDTFGSEAFWGGLLRLHEAIAGERFGGVGPGVSPRTALLVGLKVDADALPKAVLRAIQRGQADLDDPAVTLELLRQNAVVGVKGFFEGPRLASMGIQCALCHSTVDNSVAPGIGHRLDGWAARDLNVGAIVALAPNLRPLADLLGVDEATVRTVLNSWGPGKFDAELILDGKAFQPDGRSAATLIPPAFGLAGVNLHTWTGWGSVTHWNAFVSNLEMHGQGTFYDPRLNDAGQFPIAAREGFGNVRNSPDLTTSKLAALHYYQLSIPAPAPPSRSFDAAAAERGRTLFTGQARCATCHVPPLFTEPGWNMHTPAEIGIDAFQADRSPDRRYRTAPLKGLWTHATGGFYHDGRFSTLRAVVDHYDDLFGLGLSDGAKGDLVQYLLSLGDTPIGRGRDKDDDDAAARSGTDGDGATPNHAVRAIRPNPSSSDTEIQFTLEQRSPVDVTVYDVQGREVAVLARNQMFEAGEHRVLWQKQTHSTGKIAPGLYFVRLRANTGEWRRPLVRLP
jgi:cytochrome c peroxidase